MVTTVTTVTLVPARRGALDVDAVARESGLHPEVVRRMVRLGFIDPVGGSSQSPRFALDAPARLARVVRLRRDLGVGYTGAVLAVQLLDRIDELEARLRRYER
jgi:hypothetical protein